MLSTTLFFINLKIYNEIIERNNQNAEFYILEPNGDSAFSFYEEYAQKYKNVSLISVAVLVVRNVKKFECSKEYV